MKAIGFGHNTQQQGSVAGPSPRMLADSDEVVDTHQPYAWGMRTVDSPQDCDKVAVQRRTLRTLIASQALGGLGLVATYIVTALLAKDITGRDDLATVAAAFLSLGAAAAAFPLAAMMNESGRRAGLRMAYLVGAAGSAVALAGAVLGSYPILVIGVFGAGFGSAANLATRYAVTDLASDDRRARTISTIVFASTFGSVSGSLIAGLASDAGETIGIPTKGGAYLLAGAAYLAAGFVIELFLRPDPLVIAGGLGSRAERSSASESWSLIVANPTARLAVAAMVVSQGVMVGVMALTPLHMDEGGHSQSMIGAMMAFHIVGMYLFAPAIGSITDRIGQYPMLYVSGVLTTAGAVWAAITPPAGLLGVFMGNFLIGLGWSVGVIAASSLLVQEFPIEKRVGVQGVGDTAMIAAGGIMGVSSGALYAVFGYGGVNFGNAVLGGLLILLTWMTLRFTRRPGSSPLPEAQPRPASRAAG